MCRALAICFGRPFPVTCDAGSKADRLIIAGFLLVILFFARSTQLTAQVSVRPAPALGFEDRIAAYVDTVRIVDCHEHLADPRFVRYLSFLDFMLLLHQFNYNDLISAGLPKRHFDRLFTQRTTPVTKWDLIEPYWQTSFNTSYNRISIIAAQRIYNVDDINRRTVDTLSRRIARAYQDPDWTNRVLKDMSGIDYIIQDGDEILTDIDNVLYVKRFTEWLSVRSRGRIDSLARRQGNPIGTLEEFVASMENEFMVALKRGIVGVKINMAYYRTLHVDNVSIDEARRVFRSLRNGGDRYVLTWQEAKPLQDYMFLELVKLSRDNRMPVVIHTGLQSGNGNILENSNPLLLANIFLRFPEVRFGLFHGSYPFGGEVSSLAKNFPNVYIDLNWMYAISPSYSERYLNEWLETVPVGKIMGFGGDSRIAENVYGGVEVAREIITNVLVEKVRDGYFSEQEAITVARMILRDNAIKFYNIR
ncbi:MAG: amidohydrolase family protein [Bacteroidales bacterium]|jgi:glucuronate isomerase|nr:amidohydrolase family protein [Bacteroidales bacterium]